MEAPADARIALLSGLIDHAPLFPPASLPLPEAVAADERARASASGFALGRFVCPASRLAELPPVGRGISVVLDAPLDPDGHPEAVETPWRDGLETIADLAAEGYVEVPIDRALEDRLDRIARVGLHAKVRCGGASAPDVPGLARFVRACRERRIPFKATAGLHHAVRKDGEHGFLNLLAAAVFGDEEEALSERDAGAFALDACAFAWRDRSADGSALVRARRERLRSIGSCSFFEPIEELERLGVLPL